MTIDVNKTSGSTSEEGEAPSYSLQPTAYSLQPTAYRSSFSISSRDSHVHSFNGQRLEYKQQQ